MSMDSVAATALGDTIQKLPPKDKAELQQFIKNEAQKSQIQQSIHNLTDMCFKKCITSRISAGKLDKYEEPCMQNCVDRFMDANRMILTNLEQMKGA